MTRKRFIASLAALVTAPLAAARHDTARPPATPAHAAQPTETVVTYTIRPDDDLTAALEQMVREWTKDEMARHIRPGGLLQRA